MAGVTSHLTPAMDVYAFAVCCIEILGKGALPWNLLDDGTVRHYVLGALLSQHFLFRIPKISPIPG
jgi:hypothetical protein